MLLLRRGQPVQGGHLLLLGHPQAGLQMNNPKVQRQILNPQAAGQRGGAWLQADRQGAAGGDGGGVPGRVQVLYVSQGSILSLARFMEVMII